ncbi:MAG TPA: hypothetical protein VNM90_00655 [Haliangium sp.]|nr:hypothetical protein [Haliangium sp.]
MTALAALLPEIDAAWQGLHATYRAGAGTERRKGIQDQQRALDLEHDDVLRGIWFYLQSQVCLAREPAERQEVERLRDRLLPEGLTAVNKSYREEAGQAELAASRLTEHDRALLQAMVMRDGRTLLDLVQRWVELARQIGELDRERAGDVRDEVPRPAEARAARHRWIRTVIAMRDVAGLVAAQNPAIQEILGRVTAAEQVADRRAARGDTSGEPVPPEDEGSEDGKDLSGALGGS